MGINPNDEELDGGADLTTEPDGPGPVGQLMYYLFWNILKLRCAVLLELNFQRSSQD